MLKLGCFSSHVVKHLMFMILVFLQHLLLFVSVFCVWKDRQSGTFIVIDIKLRMLLLR